MIPVLICPVVSDFDLLERMLGSVDHPVGRTVVVDNSLSGYHSWRPGIEYIRPLVGLGYPGGINAGISQTPEAPWWLWCNADMTFGPTDLEQIAAIVTAAQGEPIFVTGSHRGLRNVYGAMNAATVERVGLFDEWSFYPIYFDDDDWERRLALAGVRTEFYDGGLTHVGSASIKNPELGAANGRTFAMNAQRYIDKWGGMPGAERFDTPWDLGLPLSHMRPDPVGRAARRW